ncbi:unnamed protein product [Parnassius apollo]|uniref:(apollo) hypothetical protein n=1 Tax=Parnassius apollo TaxID=110799 RepID=A0A8S3XHR6_PARAO|nr:unnamed protein product [Parnassius apollo]
MFQKISQENIENINPCDTEVAHVVAETASSQKVENVTQYQSVSQTKLNLVPNYDSEDTSNEDKPQKQLTNKLIHIYSQPQNDIAITTTPVPELEVYDNSVRERRLCTRDDPIIISPRYTDESDLDDDIEDPTYNFEDKFANFSGHINKNYLLPSRSNSDTDSTDQHVKAGRKRRKRPENWRQNRMKIKRNKGQSHKSMSKTQKIFPARCLELPCSNCRLNCSQKN